MFTQQCEEQRGTGEIDRRERQTHVCRLTPPPLWTLALGCPHLSEVIIISDLMFDIYSTPSSYNDE